MATSRSSIQQNEIGEGKNFPRFDIDHRTKYILFTTGWLPHNLKSYSNWAWAIAVISQKEKIFNNSRFPRSGKFDIKMKIEKENIVNYVGVISVTCE